ncbi:MAG: YfcE family phosphodiesterase [Gammaproteobacteria bacterium]
MRIGLISDTHIPEARPQLWDQVFAAFRGVDLILHAGDVHELFVVDQLEQIAPIYVARGNGEDGSGGRPVQPQDPRLRDAWLIEAGGLHIGMTHYVEMPERPPQFTVERTVQRLFPERRPDVLVFGDTHVEQIGEFSGILCVNPGSPTYPHGLEMQLGTIGFLDIEDGRPTASIWQITDTGIAPFDWNRWGRPW